MVEDIEPFKLHPTSMSYIKGAFTSWTVVVGHMAAHSHHYHHRRVPGFGRVGWNPIGDACVVTMWHAMVEAVEPIKLHPTSMSYIFKLFEHLQLICRAVWQHPYTLPPQMYPPIWENYRWNPRWYVSLEMISLCFGWDCRTFQTASHIHVIHI